MQQYLNDILENWIDSEHSDFLAALIDIDDFKEINDIYGHLYGDEVLIELARLMKQKIDGKGIAARYGGEEFMLLFERLSVEEAVDIINDIKIEFGNYTMNTQKIRATFSCGVEKYQANEKIDDLLYDVDQKLYQAKRSGKNQVVA